VTTACAPLAMILRGVGREVLHLAHRVQFVADDLHVGALHAELAARLAQHRLAEAVVLPDQVHALERGVVLHRVHQRGHAHVGMRVETEVPEAAALVGQHRVDRGVVEEDHAARRIALVVLVDGIEQRRGRGRRVALQHDARAVVHGGAQRGERLLVLALAVVAVELQRASAAQGTRPPGSLTPPRAFTRSTAHSRLRNTASPVLAKGPLMLSMRARRMGAGGVSKPFATAPRRASRIAPAPRISRPRDGK
jgi:hypothetical protein